MKRNASPLLRAARRGLTLIEIMVVIVIILTLMSAIAYGVWGSFNTAMVDTTKIQMESSLGNGYLS